LRIVDCERTLALAHWALNSYLTVFVFNVSEVKVNKIECWEDSNNCGRQVFEFIFLIFAPDVDHLVWCEPDVKMSNLDNDGKAVISMYLSILITETNIYNGRN
jgi:hypothetical protein